MRASRRAGEGALLTGVLALLSLSACREPPPSHDAARTLDAAHTSHAVDASRTPDAATADAHSADAAVALVPATAIEPLGTLENLEGPVTIDTTQRVRAEDGAGGRRWVGEGGPRNGPARAGESVYPGDRVETGAGGRASVTLSGASSGTQVHLLANARLVLPAFGGSDGVLTRGGARFVAHPGTASSRAATLDLPAGRIRITSGSAFAMVADEGSTLVAAENAPVEVQVTPEPAPRGRPRRRSPSRAANTPSPAAPTEGVRPVETLTAQPGTALAFTPAARRSTVRVTTPIETALDAYRVGRERALTRPGAHHVPIAQMAHAGAADLSDARALIARLRAIDAGATGALTQLGAPGTSLTDAIRAAGEAGERAPTDRVTLETALSAALGRATARADRGRALAARGGDVSSLEPMARLEEVTEQATSLLRR